MRADKIINYRESDYWVKKVWEMLISEVDASSKILYFKWGASDFSKLVESKLAQTAKSPLSLTKASPLQAEKLKYAKATLQNSAVAQ